MTLKPETSTKTVTRSKEDPHIVTCEHLDKSSTLTCFFFRHGANFYAFSHEKDGKNQHILIDTGDSMYQNRILSILTEHQIKPEDIESIIITHSHHDHCGLADLLIQHSGATLLLHANFRDLIEGSLSEESQRWIGEFDPSQLQQHNINYLSPIGTAFNVNIDGLDFPSLMKPIPIGNAGHLEILGCPESAAMHTTDQVIARYTPLGRPDAVESIMEKYRPGDDILFSGDLWLMHGPLFAGGYRQFARHMRFAYHRVKGALKGEPQPRRDPRIQDAVAKEALKKGFCLIRVMPGHGDEFLGTRIIPRSFLADRDLLIEMGYNMNEKKSLLKSKELSPKVAELREKAYLSFIEELDLWEKIGYTPDEMSAFLMRIYKEQSGGGYLVEEDRMERRERIKETLARLKNDSSVLKERKEFADATLAALSNIK